MNQDEYLEQRLDDQISWYSKKSAINQRWFKRLQLISILAAASIPFVTGFIDETTFHLKLIAGCLGLLVAAITAVLGLYKFQENWLEYRTTAETLKQEKYLFLTRTAPYDNPQAFALLVQRAEQVMANENSNWSQNIAANKSSDVLPAAK